MIKRKKKFKKGLEFGLYILQRYIASGGNGEVWVAKNAIGQDFTIKLLTRISKKSYNRFADEVKIVRNNSDIEGLLPIISFHLPKDPFTDIPYYVMPLAMPLFKALKNSKPVEIVEYFVEVADTLAELHNRNISHRDIKPANLLFYKDRIHLSDFGLVDFPDKKDITKKGEDVGPKWTMAPEMRREADSADGKKADSYSFSKTLWIQLTKQRKGFDGQYHPDTVLGLKGHLSLFYYQTLDDLLFDCTDNDPQNRLSAEKISEILKEWIKIEKDYASRNRLQWKDIQKKLFPSGSPTRAIWEQQEDIIKVLNELSVTDDLNHIFFPTGGGLNLLGVKESHEEGCIELNVGYQIILKPKRLVFESFSFEEEWNYFRLESDALAPSGYYQKVGIREILTELEPLVYTDANCNEYNDFNGKELPKGARTINRLLAESSFVIFQNTSIYNKVNATYDARHNKMTTDEFRIYIGKSIERLVENKTSHKKIPRALKIVKPSSFRSKKRLLKINEIKLLKKVITLVTDRDAESSEINKKFGIGDVFNPFDEKSINAFFEPRPKSDELKSFLKNLSQEQIALVAAVMYGGRDGIPPFWAIPLDEMINRFITDTDLVESICGKAPIIKYIKRGIRLYR